MLNNNQNLPPYYFYNINSTLNDLSIIGSDGAYNAAKHPTVQGSSITYNGNYGSSLSLKYDSSNPSIKSCILDSEPSTIVGT